MSLPRQSSWTDFQMEISSLDAVNHTLFSALDTLRSPAIQRNSIDSLKTMKSTLNFFFPAKGLALFDLIFPLQLSHCMSRDPRMFTFSVSVAVTSAKTKRVRSIWSDYLRVLHAPWSDFRAPCGNMGHLNGSLTPCASRLRGKSCHAIMLLTFLRVLSAFFTNFLSLVASRSRCQSITVAVSLQ